MTNNIIAYVGRDNFVYLELEQNGVIVTPNAVTRAVFKFGRYVLDTATPGDPISLIESKTKVRMQIGRVAGIVAGQYSGKLTIWDLGMVNGKAWGDKITVNVQEWEIS